MFNEAGVLATSDVHVARAWPALSGTVDDVVQLGVAFAARAPRLGHVCVDLHTVPETASTDSDSPVDLGAAALARTGRLGAADVASPPPLGDERPLQLEGTNLYLTGSGPTRASSRPTCGDAPPRPPTASTMRLLPVGLGRLFDNDEVPDLQRMAAATAVLRNVSVIAGGPGTGKTTTVARVLALIYEQHAAAGARPPQIALAAPTGKAAARLEEAVRREALE